MRVPGARWDSSKFVQSVSHVIEIPVSHVIEIRRDDGASGRFQGDGSSARRNSTIGRCSDAPRETPREQLHFRDRDKIDTLNASSFHHPLEARCSVGRQARLERPLHEQRARPPCSPHPRCSVGIRSSAHFGACLSARNRWHGAEEGVCRRAHENSRPDICPLPLGVWIIEGTWSNLGSIKTRRA